MSMNVNESYLPQYQSVLTQGAAIPSQQSGMQGVSNGGRSCHLFSNPSYGNQNQSSFWGDAMSMFQQVISSLMTLISTLISAISPQTPQPTMPVPAPDSGSTATPSDGSGSAANGTTNASQSTGTATPASSTSVNTSEASRAGKLDQNLLWKPVSDSDGKLVVLIPARKTGEVTKVEVVSSDQKTVLANGRYTGVGNGGREHYRFSKTGKDFPKGCYLKVTMDDGSVELVKISRPGRRMQQKGL